MQRTKAISTIIGAAMITAATAGLLLTGCGKDDPAPLAPAVTAPGDPGAPSISLSTERIELDAVRNGPPPAEQTLRVTNGGGGTLTGLALDVTYDGEGARGAGPGWLRATLEDDAAPTRMTVALFTTNMDAGIHTASISVTAASAAEAPRIIQVRCVVTEPEPGASPRLVLSRGAVVFAATAGGANPAAETVRITNGGTGEITDLADTIAYREGEPAGWLSCSLSSATAPSILRLTASAADLAAGSYEAIVAVSSPDASGAPSQIAVTCIIAREPATTGAVRVNVVTTGEDVDPTGYVVSITVGGALTRTTNVNANGYVTFSDLAAGAHTVELEDIAANCLLDGSNPRAVSVVAGTTVETTFTIACNAPPPRRVRLVNRIDQGLNLQQIVQVKLAASESALYTRDDLLTAEPAQCMALPGEAIDRGRSRAFDITAGSDYWLFIGIGTWDLDNFSCPLGRNWFKRTFFTDPEFGVHYVWTVVRVTGHESGEWEWTVSGSYLGGTLRVTPAGNAGLPFRVTASNPIP